MAHSQRNTPPDSHGTLSNVTQVAEQCVKWDDDLARVGSAGSESPGQEGSVGLVAGATDTEALCRIREIAPAAWILCPGVGAQGGDAKVI